MKTNLIAFALTLTVFSSLVHAADLKCANEAVKAATEKNFKRFGASTGSCGAKLLTAGDYREAYLVCISDETDPSEWIVVMEKNIADRNGRVTGSCGVDFADVQYDSSTPNFNNENDPALLPTVTCSADHGDDGEIHCD